MITRIWIVLFVLFAAYSAAVYIYSDGQHRESLPSASVNRGWHVWQKNNCHTCHQLYGLGGYMGPDLTNAASDPRKGREYMRAFIKYGTNSMPSFQLSDKEINDILSFLSWVDKSGKNMVSPASVHWTGNYLIN